MPLDHEDWQAIQGEISRMTAGNLAMFTQGKVVRRDTARRLVWLKEFGDQPIPIIAFDYQVKVYTVGNVTKIRTEPLTPEIGDVVLVARQLGSRKLPKCLGIIQSTGYMVSEGD